VPWHSPLNSWRTWSWFGARCAVTHALEIWRGPQNQILLKDLGGDVEREFMGPGVVGRRPSSTAHCSRRINLLSSKFCSSSATSGATKPAHRIQNEPCLGKQPSHILSNGSRDKASGGWRSHLQLTSRLRMNEATPSLVRRPLVRGASLEENFYHFYSTLPLQ
jgi:hypothetical protein